MLLPSVHPMGEKERQRGQQLQFMVAVLPVCIELCTYPLGKVSPLAHRISLLTIPQQLYLSLTLGTLLHYVLSSPSSPNMMPCIHTCTLSHFQSILHA